MFRTETMSPKGLSKLAITRKKCYRLQDSLQRLTAWSINQNWSNIIFVSEPLYSVCAQLTYIDLKYRPFIWKNCLGTFGKIIQDKYIHRVFMVNQNGMLPLVICLMLPGRVERRMNTLMDPCWWNREMVALLIINGLCGRSQCASNSFVEDWCCIKRSCVC